MTYQPGPELDTLIAERVMGWTKSIPVGHLWDGSEVDHDGALYVSADPEVGAFATAWRPSTNIAHAWEVFRRLGDLAATFRCGDGYAIVQFAEGAGHGVGSKCDPPYPNPDQADEDDHDYGSWSCHFHVGLMGEGPTYPPGWTHGAVFCARADTAEMAICLAALKAVGA